MLENLTRIWTIQIGDADTDEVTIYADQPGYPPLREGAERLAKADHTVFHNGWGFDFWVINRFFPGTLQIEQMFDTLVGARLMNPEEEDNSLAAWGRKMGVFKGEYTGDFQSFTPELVTYAKQDIVVGRLLYRKVWDAIKDWGSSVRTEMLFAYCMALQEQNGFRLDVPMAQELDAEFRGELAKELDALRDVFPARWVAERKRGEIVVKTPTANYRSRNETKDAPFCPVKLEVFNPGSRAQVASRLQALGWKPERFNKDGTAKVDDDILASLPYPEAARLTPYYAIKKKLEQISDGKSAWLKWVKPDGTVHGRVNTVGAASGRCSHSSPNMAQVNKKDLRMRAVWKPTRPGWKLVGCDGEGLQARALAHFLARYDGGSYAQKIVSGNKKLKTDEHASNLQVLPILKAAYDLPFEDKRYGKARDGAKTCLYCVLFGGQDPKLGRTVKEAAREVGFTIPKVSDKALGAEARKALFRAIRGFEDLAKALRATIEEKGYLRGPDGRHVRIRSKHSALVFLMQAVEAAAMKLAMVIFHFEKAPANGWVYGQDFAYCANVHDEAQLEARPELAGTNEDSPIGAAFAACITEAGERLGLRCPLAGSYAVGDAWAATH